MADGDMKYVQQSFLTACAARSVLKKDEATQIFSEIWRKGKKYAFPFRILYFRHPTGEEEADYPQGDEMKETIEAINSKIAPLEQQLVWYTYNWPKDGDVDDLQECEYLVFINTAETAMNKFQVLYTDAECQFFQLVLEGLIEDEEHSLDHIDCLNLTAEVTAKGQGVTKARAEDLISTWTEIGYLYTDTERVYLGPRALAELGNSMINDHECQKCAICEKLIIWGRHCANCDAFVHDPCITKYLESVTTCPSCKQLWAAVLRS